MYHILDKVESVTNYRTSWILHIVDQNLMIMENKTAGENKIEHRQEQISILSDYYTFAGQNRKLLTK